MKSEHYFTRNPTSKEEIRTFEDYLRGNRFVFKTSSGIFSPQKIDLGTKLLVNDSVIPSLGKILDLGCGYGAVGIAIKKSFPQTNVFMSDINERAVRLAKENAKKNNVDVNIKSGEFFSAFPEEKFDVILLNPPQTAGKNVCFKMIEDSKNYLNLRGTLQLVARHQKGGETLSKKMLEVFGNVKTVSIKSGYRIYLSEN
jgi:16S rRNA (guanine1207-N2)-methyltransferase